jgi:carbon storage regulator
MLVLTRRVGEKLVIGNEVIIEVVAVSGEGVRLGITAPRETSVHRFEIFAEIQAANEAASSFSSSDQSLADLAAQLRERELDKPDEQT